MRSSSARTSRLLSARLAGFHSRLKFLVVRAILSFAPFRRHKRKQPGSPLVRVEDNREGSADVMLRLRGNPESPERNAIAADAGFSEELAAFCQSPLAVIVASVRRSVFAMA